MSLSGLDLLLAAELDPLLRTVAVDGNPGESINCRRHTRSFQRGIVTEVVTIDQWPAVMRNGGHSWNAHEPQKVIWMCLAVKIMI